MHTQDAPRRDLKVAQAPVGTARTDALPAAAGVVSRQRLLPGAAFLVVVALVFARPLYELAIHVAGTDLHSHILLVPFISAYLLYIRWSEMPKAGECSPLPAGIAFSVGCAAWFFSQTAAFRPPVISHNDHLALVAFAFVCSVAAGGFALLGTRWMRAASFPMFFLLFLVPLPDGVVASLETASKLGSAETSHLFFSLSGVPFYREGLVFQLPGIALEVARECSGIRSSWVLFITSVLVSNMFLRTTWHRAVLVLFVIPLGLLRNGLRILVIGLLCVHVGPEMIDSLIHQRGGPLFFALSLIPLLGLLWWLRSRELTALRRRDIGDARPD